MSLNQITFEDSDYKYPALEAVATEIADFLYCHRSKVQDFAEFMRVSSTRNISNYKPFLQKWVPGYIGPKRRAAADTLRLAELATKFFEVCSNDKEIKKIRGLVPEKLFEKIFEQRHNGATCNKGYGAKVIVCGETIIYRASSVVENEEDSDKNRRTVDAGFWNGADGEFVEVKFSPEAFQTKDINYLRLLSDKLSTNDFPYKIFLVCLDHFPSIKIKLERLGLWKNETEFVLVGREELFDLTLRESS